MKKTLLLLPICVLLFASCANTARYEKVYPAMFDIDSTLVCFADSAAKVKAAQKAAGDIIALGDKFFDIYNSYDGISNLKTINENAGIAPVKVDPMVIDLLEFCVRAYDATDGLINVALGPVLSIWHDHREEGIADQTKATLPKGKDLIAANKLTDIHDVVIDRASSTVFLKKAGMSLDVGAIAKGWTAQRAADAVLEAGVSDFLLNMGGNVVARGKPRDRDTGWRVGLHNPLGGEYASVVPAGDESVVTSGAYERFYVVDEISYGHIIDPATLFPPSKYSQVSVTHGDSAVAEMLSTALFITDIENGKRLAEKFGAQAFWVIGEGKYEKTDGWKGENS